MGIILWGTMGAIKGDTRSLDSSSYVCGYPSPRSQVCMIPFLAPIP